ncbi:GNAT family N-acetyltransferase [Paenibacillus radicis (ex Xue et al. 2023)]|uniref:GNAT family N-acetyltransferase n=1 Tax=Paenibacillus radicis (ex Xue et al. 2023) TaxID=2972489 RepID=A0ABT1YBN2_9BACL|nr:GNAT family N-acetyltransferase [Paenibacillus radicis (ex Xue et al. 2023)]MCR8630312.1 GNAT family N-acetyltransferase [Paenibacillus radicis (ex Xue et al. 2023)]
MKIELSLLPYEDKTILYNLIQLYRYDSSEFDGHALNNHGFYLYKYFDHQWTDEYRRPFIVKVDGEIAGFALVSLDVPTEYMKLSSAEVTNVISDFFIMRKYRRKGVGKEVALLLFEQFHGTWEIRQTLSNKNAYEFWRNVIKEYKSDGTFQEEMIQNSRWNGPVFVFQTQRT